MNYSNLFRSKKESDDEGILRTYYSCPMHPEINKEKPGMCPVCGMNLVEVKKRVSTHDEHMSHNKHEGHDAASFLKKFWISLFLTIPIFFYSEMASMLGVGADKFPGYQYVLLLVGSFIFFYAGSIFLTSAYRELKAKMPGMMTLIALAISAAYFYSVFSILSGMMHDLLFEVSSLITIMLLGHWIEMKSVQGAQGALDELAKLLPDKAEVVRGSSTEIISIDELRTGDIVVVKPGLVVPADGEVVEGSSGLNESVITGESKPVEKSLGDMVIAGSINGDGSLKVKIIKIGEHTFLAGVMRLVADAQASKSQLQLLSDRAAFYLTIIAIVVGTITFVVWLLVGGGIVTATERFVAVLVITCPHALGLAVPLVASISTRMAARAGLLVKDRRALELSKDVNVVLFDKTGTLTKGVFGVYEIFTNEGVARNEVLKLAASLNNNSEHPLAKAFVDEAKKENIILGEVKDFSRVAGKGVRGAVENRDVFVGNDSFVDSLVGATTREYKNKLLAVSKEGKTIIHVVVDKKLFGSIALADIIREESREAIKNLKARGIKTAMITGDSEDVASWVAQELGIDEYFSRVMPEQKVEKVKLLQQRGHKVAMVGDGVNDAPALTQADLGIAIGAGTNVAIESAGIILVKNDPRDIMKIINLSRLTYQKMIQNLFWATGYNIIAIPLAAGVFVSWGMVLEPALAAALMSVSTIIVAFNAMLLRGKKI